MKSHIFVCIVAVFLLCACSNQSLSEDYHQSELFFESTKAARDSNVFVDEEAEQSIYEVNQVERISAVRVSTVLEEGYTVIAGQDIDKSEESGVYVYLYADAPIYDLLISRGCGYLGVESTEFIEIDGFLYMAELNPRQAVKLSNPYPYPYSLANDESYYTQIAYTNSDGDYEAALLLGEKEKENVSLFLLSLDASAKLYDEDYFGSEYYMDIGLLSEEIKAKLQEGAFDAYIPKGFCITRVSISDVNGDGIEDVLICFKTSNRHAAAYSGVMPLFVLIGQPDGGYVIEKRIGEALFIPYRSTSYPVAGEGYIDIIYDYVGGAGCHHTQTNRFWYHEEKNDWLLEQFMYQPSFIFENSSYEMLSGFVRPLPSFFGMSLETFSGDEYYNSVVEWNYFDIISEMIIPSQNEHNTVYTLAINRDVAAGSYEGYIYRYYESLESGGFIQTIYGTYKSDMDFTITINEEEKEFIVQGDVWRITQYDADAFYLVE